MAANTSTEHIDRLVLDAIRQRDPEIRPGDTFDWLIIRTRLHRDLTDDEFSIAMTQLGNDDLIGADASRRAFTLTEKGYEAMHRDGLAELTLDEFELA